MNALRWAVLVIAVLAFLGPGEINILITIGAVDWVTYSRLVRGEVLREKNRELRQGCGGTQVVLDFTTTTTTTIMSITTNTQRRHLAVVITIIMESSQSSCMLLD